MSSYSANSAGLELVGSRLMSPTDAQDQKVATVVVTYKRQELLNVLFDSYKLMHLRPNWIVVVDNENSPETAAIVELFSKEVKDTTEVIYEPMPTNSGGAGGFSRGAEIAYNTGADWVWMMDDDVKVYPDALDKLMPFLSRGVKKEHRVIQPQRDNYDDTPFYWQYHFLTGLGIPNPIAPSAFEVDEDYKLMNTACFEGGLFHRSIIREVGLPDARFFIYWDDTIYGYLASKLTEPALMNMTCLKRTRQIDNLKIGSVRKLNSTSDMARYHIMRNRGFMANYFKIYGDHKRFRFGIGTFLTLLKEVIRLFVSKEKHPLKGLKLLIKGALDARKILHDKSWKPVGPYLNAASSEDSKPQC